MEAGSTGTTGATGAAVENGARAEAARRALGENRVWYHTIELAPGIATPGYVDLRPLASRILPDDLTGKRALDVGTFDGFWAFEMERRGAEVVAIDIENVDRAEWPPIQRERLERRAREWEMQLGRGFGFAAELLGSRAERVICNVYDLTSEAIGGPVDFVFSGAILIHLRDPIRALERIHDVLRPGGELRLMEPFSVALTLRSPRRPAAVFQPLDTPFNWWRPNLAALRAWLRTARFERIDRVGFVRPDAVETMRRLNVAISASRGS